MNKITDKNETIHFLSKIINSKNHINVRLRFTEIRLIDTWFRSNFSEKFIDHLIQDESNKHWLSCAGIFPLTKDEVKKFLFLYSDIIQKLSKENQQNVSYSCTLHSELLENTIFQKNQKIDYALLNVCSSHQSFQPCLKNKKLCIVTPFPLSFSHQLDKLNQLFDDGRLENLDKNNIVFIKSPPHKFISNEKENPFETWSDALESMKSEIDKKNYDILLTGCGAFSLPLNYHAYKNGKTTLNMGGDLQLMFGVKGKRWKQEEYNFNKNWIFPLEEEVPQGNFKVEGGAYW